MLVCLFSHELSRQRDTILLKVMPSLRHESVVYARYIRRNFLSTRGKIGLPLCLLLVSLFDATNEVGKLEQISHAKGGATGCKHHTGIRRSKARPGCWQRPHMIRSLVKGDPVFPPIVPVGEDLKLLTVQGMKGMGDRENSFCQRGRRCS